MARRLQNSVLILLVVLSLQSLQVRGQQPQFSGAGLETFNGCGMEGDASRPAMKALNRLKNRHTAPGAGDINPAVTLAAILAPGNDIGRWKVRYGTEIAGYVYDVKPGPVESVDCGARRVADRDTHIELVLSPMDSSATRPRDCGSHTAMEGDYGCSRSRLVNASFA